MKTENTYKAKQKDRTIDNSIQHRSARGCYCMHTGCHKGMMACIIMTIILVITASGAAADMKVPSYLYTLSNFNGPILSHWANIYVDKERNDVYVVDRRARDIRIFDQNGMEVYIFGDDERFGVISDLTVDGDGNIIIISRTSAMQEIVRCNFRGEPVSKIMLSHLPEEYSRFQPSRIIYRDGKLYMVQIDSLRIVVTDANGVFETGYDIADLLSIDDSKREQNEITGFSLDSDGNMLFSISVLFQAYRLSPDKNIEPFGKAGGGPGTFGVIAGIVSDESGNIYIADKLRCVVLVFDKNLEFQTEFGYRGNRPGNLIVPNDMDIDSSGRLFVAQAGERGVSVFSVSHR